MRLVEYLFGDPGGPPQPDHGYSTMAVDGEGTLGLASRTEHPSEYGYGTPGTAYLDGQPVDHLARGYSQETAMRYRAMLAHTDESLDEAKQYKIKDKVGNSLPVEVEHDTEGNYYVAVVRGGRYHRMASGAERQQIRDHATGATPDAAVKALAKKLRESIPGPSVQSFSELLDEVLKKGENVNSSRDKGVISKLEGGKYPNRAEDGKGFCFQWADGRGICAFRMKADALKWAKEQPRDIVKFWYGEPVHSNGKFRIRVSDNYRKDKDESVDEAESGTPTHVVCAACKRRVKLNRLERIPKHGQRGSYGACVTSGYHYSKMDVALAAKADLAAYHARQKKNESAQTFSDLLAERALEGLAPTSFGRGL